MSRRDEILTIARSVKALPPLAVDLLTTIRDQDADVSEIARIIEHDPSVAANLLKMANSASLGLRNSVSSVKQALVRIGLRRVTELVLDVALAPVVAKPIRGYDLPVGALWEHSAAVAIVADVLAEQRSIEAPIDLFTAGLLHDVGKIVLGTFVEVEFDQIREFAFDRGLSFDQAERDILGIDHAELGAMLLQDWGLPESMAEIVRCHHRPEEAGTESEAAAHLIHTCVQIVTAAGIGGGADGSHYETSPKANHMFDVTPSLIESVLCQTHSRLEEIHALRSAAGMELT